MDKTELNKTFTALLIAGIIAIISGFISNMLVPSETLADNHFAVESVVASADKQDDDDDDAEESSLSDMIASADIEHGKKIFKKCAACHSFDAAAGHKIGPNLAGVVDREVAHFDDFKYSDAMKAKGGTWTEEELNKFLKKPAKVVPKSKMSFPGLKKDEDRAAIIKLLKEQK